MRSSGKLICRLVVFALSAIMVTACEPGVFSDPTIDGSNPDSMKESVARVQASLPLEKQEQFSQGLLMIAFSELDVGDVLTAGATGNADSLILDAAKALDGKTGQEVIDEAARLRIMREEMERAQALEELRELEERVAQAEASALELSKFKVVRSRFSKRPREFGRAEPIIELSVMNGTDATISRAYFKGTIATPGREVPWFTHGFNYPIPGGLEPNEEASWVLSPNAYSAWGSAQVPEDAVFTVTVERVDGADGGTLFSAQGLSASELARLKSLRSRYTH